MLKYLYKDITFREIPGEVSLTLSLSNCQGTCTHCHSPELRKDIGTDLTPYELDTLMDKYLEHITTICFLGDPKGIKEVLAYLRDTYDVKLAVYSGQDHLREDLVDLLDFYKVGRYDHEYGGLDKETTNQKMYYIKDKELKDITYKFQK